MIHFPSLPTSQFRDATITVSTILSGQPSHVTNQLWLVIRYMSLATLRASRLAQHTASPTLRHTVPPDCVSGIFNRLTSFRRAQKFPDAASFSTAFRRFAWSIRKPPYSLRQRISV